MLNIEELPALDSVEIHSKHILHGVLEDHHTSNQSLPFQPAHNTEMFMSSFSKQRGPIGEEEVSFRCLAYAGSIMSTLIRWREGKGSGGSDGSGEGSGRGSGGGSVVGSG